MIDNPDSIIEERFDNKSVIALNIFWVGFIIYIASFTISTSGLVSYVVCNLFQIAGLLMMLPSAVFIMQLRIDNKYLRILFLFYFLWLLGVFIRGLRFDYIFLKQLLFDPGSGLLLYLVPLVILFPRNPSHLKKVFDVIIILGLFYIAYASIFIKEILKPFNDFRSQAIIEYFSQHLSLPTGFMLLTFLFHSGKRKLFALFIICLTFFFTVIRARRGLMLISFSMLLFSYFLFQLSNKKKIINSILSIFIISIISFVAVRLYDEQRKDTFGLITERIGQQTRSRVEEYFYRDLNTKDWIIGKGMNGKYFCPGVEEGIGRISIYRSVIETGFLQIILNGGLISLGLLLLIAIPAIFKGLFNSKNLLSKAAAMWIVIFLLYLYPGTPAIFSLYHILVWISIGICYSEDIRNSSDSYIKKIFSGKKVSASIEEIV